MTLKQSRECRVGQLWIANGDGKAVPCTRPSNTDHSRAEWGRRSRYIETRSVADRVWWRETSWQSSALYTDARPFMQFCTSVASLNLIRWRIGSQCKDFRIGVMCSDRQVSVAKRAAVFRSHCNRCSCMAISHAIQQRITVVEATADEGVDQCLGNVRHQRLNDAA